MSFGGLMRFVFLRFSFACNTHPWICVILSISFYDDMVVSQGILQPFFAGLSIWPTMVQQDRLWNLLSVFLCAPRVLDRVHEPVEFWQDLLGAGGREASSSESHHAVVRGPGRIGLCCCHLGGFTFNF